jgi:hypothetical protein
MSNESDCSGHIRIGKERARYEEDHESAKRLVGLLLEENARLTKAAIEARQLADFVQRGEAMLLEVVEQLRDIELTGDIRWKLGKLRERARAALAEDQGREPCPQCGDGGGGDDESHCPNCDGAYREDRGREEDKPKPPWPPVPYPAGSRYGVVRRDGLPKPSRGCWTCRRGEDQDDE